MPAGLKEKCAVFGVNGVGFDAARVVHDGLYALQHRGQESTGEVSVDINGSMHVHKGMGLVAHVYDEQSIESLPGETAIGHNRYSTSLGSTIEHVQPIIRGDLALGHNGNLPSTTLLEEYLQEFNIETAGRNDSEMMTIAIARVMESGASLEEAVAETYPLFTGAFSLVLMSGDKIVAVRDHKGIRPLSIGKLNGGYIFASETCALDVVGAQFVGDVAPGQMVTAHRSGELTYEQLVQGQSNLDIFEFIYFARPDSMLLGKRVYEVRGNLGRQLYREQPSEADVVIGIPDSALPAALAYAQEAGIPYGDGFIKNRYIHRTFIEPEQHMRNLSVQRKLNPLPEVVKGRRVIVIDDSIVRGTNAGPIIKLLRNAGAKEVHMKISSPPVLYPDFYGIDTPHQHKLIAAKMNLADLTAHIGADSLQYLSYDGMIRATGLPEELFSTSCFTGIYPIDIGEQRQRVEKVVFQY